jgi:sterol desaturase/sphingolipid hydroxylase (fatty acid hydroxylase superfamily)
MGYVNYDLTHYLIHHKNFKDGYMKSLRDKHIRHHYIESSCGFAVSNHIWDIVMGTESSVKNKEG